MSDQATRNLTGVPASAGSVRRGRSVIAVIGIDRYQAWPQLHNAVGDAQGLRGLFIEQLGFSELTPPLIDAQASHDAITALIQDQLRSLLRPDDSLVLFFAGHGHTETTQAGTREVTTGYLIPVDARPQGEHRFSSYLNLDTLLKDVAQLPARHILVILDSCHSGFALNEVPTVQIVRGADRYSEVLSARMSRRVVTSALHDQAALDSGPVAGHSLFTGTLIEALDKGAADTDRKGFVTSSELALYVQRSVASWSGSRQTPDFGAFELDDRGELVISLRGETHDRRRAGECARAGDAIAELGWHTADPRRFRSAARQYRDALKYAELGKIALPQAELGLAKALFAAGQSEAAAQVLGAIVDRDGPAAPAETLLYLGMARAKLRLYQPAAEALAAWRAGNPDHPDAAWVGAYHAWLSRAANPGAGGRRALLIGIDEYQLPQINLRGSANDVERLMQPALMRCCGFQEQEITTLVNRRATRAACLEELERLARTTTANDSVLVFFSGHAVPSSHPDAFGPNNAERIYLITHDTHKAQGSLACGIRADELHRLLQAIPATHKTLILDTHPSSELVDLATREGTYALILASDTAEVAYEFPLKLGEELCYCGLLTAALWQALSAAPAQPITYDSWVTPAIAAVEQTSADPQLFGRKQTPLFVGLKELSVFGDDDAYLPAFEFAQRRHWPEDTPDLLRKQYTRLCQTITAPHPRAHAAYGRALLGCGAYAEAIVALERAQAQLPAADPDVLLNLTHAQLAARRYPEALLTLQSYRDSAPAERQPALAELIDRLSRCAGGRRQAVLVGIDRYRGAEIPALGGARNDVAALRQELTTRWGFAPEDVVVLEDAAATRAAILAAFQGLAEAAHDGAALFHFSGYGSCDQDRLPAIVSHDGRSAGVPDITLEELAALVGAGAANLSVTLDADLSGEEPERQRRALPPDPAPPGRAARFATDEERRAWLESLHLGAVTIMPHSGGQDAARRPPLALALPIADMRLAVAEGDRNIAPAGPATIPAGGEGEAELPGAAGRRAHGAISAALITALAQADPGATAVAALVDELRRRLDLDIRADPATRALPLFVPAAHGQIRDWLAAQADHRRLQAVIDSLAEIVALRAAREDHWPEGLLNLGVALAARGDYPAAQGRLEEAVALFSGENPYEGPIAMRA